MDTAEHTESTNHPVHFIDFLRMGLWNAVLGIFIVWAMLGFLYGAIHKDVGWSDAAVFEGALVVAVIINFCFVFLWYGRSRSTREYYVRSFRKAKQLYAQDQRSWLVFRTYPSLFILLGFIVLVTPLILFGVPFTLLLSEITGFATSLLLGAFASSTWYCLGSLLVAEMYQRYVLHTARHNLLAEMLRNGILAIPYIILLTFTWWIFLILGSKNKDRATQNLTLSFVLEMIRVFVVINLGAIALHDTHYSFAKTKALIRQEASTIGKTWLYSGLSLMPFLMPLFVIMGWGPYIDFPQWMQRAFILYILMFSWLRVCLMQMNYLFFLAEKKGMSSSVQIQAR